MRRHFISFSFYVLRHLLQSFSRTLQHRHFTRLSVQIKGTSSSRDATNIINSTFYQLCLHSCSRSPEPRACFPSIFVFSSSHHLHQKPGFAYTPSLSLCFLSARFLCSDPHNRFIDTFPSPRVIRAVYTARCGFHCFYADSPTVVLTCEVQERDPLFPIFFFMLLGRQR